MYYNISITSSKYICLSDFLSSFRSCSVCPEPDIREGGRERVMVSIMMCAGLCWATKGSLR